ncbi:MAG: hypothetical protein II338_00515 [Bacteroidaceae bacterium]|nr:hypothetical protein [Bacteroidaceae bacterium]MBQ5835580.1 hypothetical protein [Bacteroidaceae bacterium]
MNMKKVYRIPQADVLSLEAEKMLAGSVVMEGEGKDDIEFETRKRHLIWGKTKN